MIPIRTKKVKTGGNAYNRRRVTPGKHRRLYVEDGEWVESDHLLVRQIGLQFYPGQNVKIFIDLHYHKKKKILHFTRLCLLKIEV